MPSISFRPKNFLFYLFDSSRLSCTGAFLQLFISQFGFDSRVVSAVGEDKLGNEILKNFDAKKLNYLIEKVPYPTGTVQVELDPNGVPMYDIKENVAWDNIPFTSALEELAKKTRSVCFGLLAQRSVVSRETINSFLNAMPDGEGQCKIFDVNLLQQGVAHARQ